MSAFNLYPRKFVRSLRHAPEPSRCLKCGYPSNGIVCPICKSARETFSGAAVTLAFFAGAVLAAWMFGIVVI